MKAILSLLLFMNIIISAHASSYYLEQINDQLVVVVGKGIVLTKVASLEMEQQNSRELKELKGIVGKIKNNREYTLWNFLINNIIPKSFEILKDHIKDDLYLNLKQVCINEYGGEAKNHLEGTELHCSEFREPKLKLECRANAKLLCSISNLPTSIGH